MDKICLWTCYYWGTCNSCAANCSQDNVCHHMITLLNLPLKLLNRVCNGLKTKAISTDAWDQKFKTITTVVWIKRRNSLYTELFPKQKVLGFNNSVPLRLQRFMCMLGLGYSSLISCSWIWQFVLKQQYRDTLWTPVELNYMYAQHQCIPDWISHLSQLLSSLDQIEQAKWNFAYSY